MLDIIDMLHYLIGLIIVGIFIWFIVQVHNYFSKDNIPIFFEPLTNIKP
jgi:hypothetical protein